VYDQAVDVARIRARYLPLLDFLPAVSTVAVIWYGGHQVLGGHLQTGQLVAFYAYVLMLITPLRMTGNVVAQAQRAVASTQRVKEILDAAPVIKDTPKSRHLPKGEGEVRFENVVFSYGDGGRRVLDDCASPRQVPFGADALVLRRRLLGEAVLLKAARPALLPRRRLCA